LGSEAVGESCGWINPRLVRELPGWILHAVAPNPHNDLCALEQCLFMQWSGDQRRPDHVTTTDFQSA
jgi:hypothetical protein